jgi:hypothetical protein
MRGKGVFVAMAAICTWSSLSCAGQSPQNIDSGRYFFVAASAQRGRILVQDQQAAHLVQKDAWSAQLELSVVKNTQRTWNYCNCYSKNGASLSYVDFGNPTNLGHSINLATYVEPYLSFSRKLQFSFRAGAGLAYLNRTFNALTNPDNTFYSRRLSFLMLVNLNAYYAITPALRASATVQFSHISNGGARDPNWGINYPTVGIGLEYMLQPETLRPREHQRFTNRSIKVITHLFGGQRPLQGHGTWPDKRAIIAGINTGVVKPLGRINAIGLGAELYYDGTSRLREARDNKDYKPLVGALSIQHYFFFGRLLFGQQLAYQVTALNPDVSKRIYQRYFLEYRISRNWYGGVSLKAYGNISENLAITTALVL